MASTILAHFDSEADADRILTVLAKKVTLQDSAVLTPDAAGALTVESLSLSPDERAACEAQLKRGGFILLAQADESGPMLRALDEIAPQALVVALQPSPSSDVAAPAQAVEEETIPIVEAELRVGKREVRRGTARVHSFPVETPARQEVDLLEEEANIARRPVNRRLTDEEVISGGLLKERVFEIAEMREEAVVSKEAYVREELVMAKDVRQRTEQIEDTVRRTEVEMERLEPEETAPR